jgi:hypothetical protein
MRNFIVTLSLFLVSTLSTQAQSLKIDNVSLNIVNGGKLELLIDKIYDSVEVTRMIHVKRVLKGPNDTNYDITDVSLGKNDYNLMWDGVKGVYEMTVTTVKNGKTTVKKGILKFI